MDPLHRKKLPPRAPSNFRSVVVEELLAFWSFITSNWIFVLPSLLLIVLLIYVVRPMPPKTLTIGTGQLNSTPDVVGRKYHEFFKRHGVELKLVPTKGAVENLQLLKEGKVDAAFSQGGLPLGDDIDNVRSLGAIAYQPLWFFYYGNETDEPDLTRLLAGRKVSVNVEGSSTRGLTMEVLEAQGVDTSAPNFLAMKTPDSVAAFKEKKIDGLFLVGGMDSKNIWAVSKFPGVKMYDFRLAEAYSKKFPYLEVVKFPTGGFSFHPVTPAKDIHMIATTLDILTTERLHPALQLLFMEATTDFEQKRVSYFTHGKFPVYMDTRIQESDVARRYFKEGSPFLWGYAPYWVASLFDEVWFYLLAIGAIVIPLIGFVPSYRRSHAVLSIEHCYDELRAIETMIIRARQLSEPVDPDLLEQIDLLSDEARELWVPTGNRNAYYDLRAAITIVREDLLVALGKKA